MKRSKPEDFTLIKRRTIRYAIGHIFRFISEYSRVIFFYRKIPPCITVFGSARSQPDSEFYRLGESLGAALAKRNIPVMTGGGPGLMEATNKGCKNAGGTSLGCNITLQHEQIPNPYLLKTYTCRYFFIRKLALTRYSYAFIALPGGYGTLDELFEMLNLIITKRISSFPIVLLGKSFWAPIFEFITTDLVNKKMISSDEHSMILLTDNVEEALNYIQSHAKI